MARQQNSAQKQSPRIGRSTWLLAAIGPGIVVAGSVMGSGELLNTPKQAAEFGFVLLWSVLLACVIKFFLQVEIGRYCLVNQCTPHEALNHCPGPKWRGTSWIGIIYMVGYVVSGLVIPGIVGALAGMMHREFPLFTTADGEHQSVLWWGILLGVLAVVLLWRGFYRRVETMVALLVGGFSFTLAFGLLLLQWSEYGISAGELASGLTFSLGEENRAGAMFAVISLMGGLGCTANELFMYPYWILEKGYGQEMGDPNDRGWVERGRHWIRAIHVDAAVSTALATVMTAAFFLLGCAILRPKLLAGEITVEGVNVVDTISQVYTTTFGDWSRQIFLVGAFCTLFSTVIVNTAATGRMTSDFLNCLGFINRRDTHVVMRCHQLVHIAWMLFILAVFAAVPGKPLWLVTTTQFFIGVIMTPMIMFPICWMAFHTDRRLRMGTLSAVLLVVTSVLIITCVWGGLAIQYWPSGL